MATQQNYMQWRRRRQVETERIDRGLKSGWRFLDGSDVRLMGGLRRVEEEKRPGLFGSSYLKSKVIALNPNTIKDSAVLWASSAIHEAIHGVQGGDEEPALRREFRLLGRIYKDGGDLRDRGLVSESVRAAIIAMKQRVRDVPAEKRKGDRDLLVGFGFSERAADLIMQHGGAGNGREEEVRP